MALTKGTKRIVDKKELKEGDMLVFVRAGGLYFHCGIFDGKNSVYHRAAEPGSGSRAAFDLNSKFAKFGIESDKAKIRKDDLRRVAGSSPVLRINMFDSVMRPLSGSESLKKADERLGEKGYNLLYKNCQHFCTEIRYGTGINMQVEVILGLRISDSSKYNSVLVNLVELPGISVDSLPTCSARTKIVQPSHSKVIENVPDKSLIPFLTMSGKQRSLSLALNISTQVLAAMMLKPYTNTPSMKRESHLLIKYLPADTTQHLSCSSETTQQSSDLSDTTQCLSVLPNTNNLLLYLSEATLPLLAFYRRVKEDSPKFDYCTDFICLYDDFKHKEDDRHTPLIDHVPMCDEDLYTSRTFVEDEDLVAMGEGIRNDTYAGEMDSPLIDYAPICLCDDFKHKEDDRHTPLIDYAPMCDEDLYTSRTFVEDEDLVALGEGIRNGTYAGEMDYGFFYATRRTSGIGLYTHNAIGNNTCDGCVLM